MSQPLDPSVVAWVNRGAAKLRADGWTPGSPRETEMLQFWRQHRPKMWAALEARKLAVRMAFVLERKRAAAKKQYIQAGMPIPDADQEARKEWMLLEPETDRPHQSLLGQISTLMTPSS